MMTIKNVPVTALQFKMILRATTRTAKYSDYLGQTAIANFTIESVGKSLIISYKTTAKKPSLYSEIYVCFCLGPKGGLKNIYVSQGGDTVIKKHCKLFV